MTDSELKSYMENLYQGCINKSLNLRNVIGNAVQLGMRYQEEKIKAGVDIVFNELHNKK